MVGIDILHIRITLETGVITLCLLLAVGRVALWVVEELITVEDAPFLLVVVRASEVVVVIAGRVVAPGLDDTVVGDHTTVHHGVEPLLIGTVLALLLIVQTIEAHILIFARATGRDEGIGLRRRDADLTPLCGGEGFAVIHGHGTLVRLLAVAEDIL